jgi:hypothetical protein
LKTEVKAGSPIEKGKSYPWWIKAVDTQLLKAIPLERRSVEVNRRGFTNQFGDDVRCAEDFDHAAYLESASD